MLDRVRLQLGLVAAFGVCVAWGVACSAGGEGSEFTGKGTDDEGGAAGSTMTTAGMGGDGGLINPTTGGNGGGTAGTMMNPCGTECGPEELCTESGLAKDDDCDGQVDEECPCVAGTQQPCFKGD